MKFRKLRIAWSITWGMACLLLITGWVRSYFIGDSVEHWHNRTRMMITSVRGQFVAVSIDYSPTVPAVFRGFKFHSWNFTNLSSDRYVENSFQMRSLLGFRIGRVSATVRSHAFLLIGIPYCFPAFIAVLLGASPWFLCDSRFSLRTLLIATTLIAVRWVWRFTVPANNCQQQQFEAPRRGQLELIARPAMQCSLVDIALRRGTYARELRQFNKTAKDSLAVSLNGGYTIPRCERDS